MKRLGALPHGSGRVVDRLKVFADATRVRLLALLEREELTVAELSAITRLARSACPRTGEAEGCRPVRDRRAGVRPITASKRPRRPGATRAVATLRAARRRLLRQDADRVPRCWPRANRTELGRRGGRRHERHYSRVAPGKHWRALRCRCSARATCWTSLGRRVLAELLAPHSRRYVCVMRAHAWSPRPVNAWALCERRSPRSDMHALPFPDVSFASSCCAALTYASKPAQAVAEAARVLRAGDLLFSSLASQNTAPWWRPTATPTSGSPRRTTAPLRREAGVNVAGSGTVTRERRPRISK